MSLSPARALPSAREVLLVPQTRRGHSRVLWLPKGSWESNTSPCLLFLQTQLWCMLGGLASAGAAAWKGTLIFFPLKKLLRYLFLPPSSTLSQYPRYRLTLFA